MTRGLMAVSGCQSVPEKCPGALSKFRLQYYSRKCDGGGLLSASTPSYPNVFPTSGAFSLGSAVQCGGPEVSTSAHVDTAAQCVALSVCCRSLLQNVDPSLQNDGHQSDPCSCHLSLAFTLMTLIFLKMAISLFCRTASVVRLSRFVQ